MLVKGVKEYNQSESIARDALASAIKQVFSLYGFDPLESPVLETLDVLTAKSGPEIKGQLFKIQDKDVGLRFDLTVGLARFAATNNTVKPFKRYIIGKSFRLEEPQKGRYREFTQADIDIIGVAGPEAEIELLACANELFKRLDLPVTIAVNDRRIIDSLAQQLELDNEQKLVLYRALDKVDKLGFEKAFQTTNLPKAAIKKIQEFTLIEGNNKEKLSKAKKTLSKADPAVFEQLEKIAAQAEKIGLPIKVDYSIIRGLGYYTSTVFEIQTTDGFGSLAGGGRYDDLTKLYGAANPACGLGLGFERIAAILAQKESNGTTAKQTNTLVFIANIGEEPKAFCQKIAKTLRCENIATETDLMGRNIKKQLDYANAKQIPFVAIVGPKELEAKKVTLKNLKTGKEQTLLLEQLVEELKL